ncbi:MAG: muconolactone Delta-isomerase family protein [Cyclobacteriaceae bacterium]
MKKFMVKIVFKSLATPEKIQPLLEAEQNQVKLLISNGNLETIYLTPDKQRGWIIMKGNGKAEVESLMKGLPLYPYMKVKIFELGDN